jgi:protein gp37
MSQNSAIEWTDATWNPVRGCTKVSPGCKHCYASTFAERFRGVPEHPYEQGFDLRLVPEKLVEPLKWSSSKRIFVNSMSDLFHEGIPSDYIAKVEDVMAEANWHTFQVLTKRAERLQEHSKASSAGTLSNIWWGVSVEDRNYGVKRIQCLRDARVRFRFLSVEPLLEDLGEIDLSAIDWVIVGGESGFGARPMNREWVLSLRDQCQEQHVRFFFKQWGGVQKKRFGRDLEGKTYDELPPLSDRSAPDKRLRDTVIEGLNRRWGVPASDMDHGFAKEPLLKLFGN